MAARETRIRDARGFGPASTMLARLLVAAARLQFALLARLFSELEPREEPGTAGMCKNYRCVLLKGLV
jgi:hypothetical protein